MENNKKRKFYNLYLNNNVCGEDAYSGYYSNFFDYVHDSYDNYGNQFMHGQVSCGKRALIIAELVDGKMIDIITEDVLLLNKDNIPAQCLTYSAYELMSKEAVVSELEKHSSNSIKRYKESMQKVKDATVENYKNHLYLIQRQKMYEEEKQRIKDIANNGFDSFMNNFKKRTRK